MPVDDLPSYPTPQQAAYIMDPPRKSSHPQQGQYKSSSSQSVGKSKYGHSQQPQSYQSYQQAPPPPQPVQIQQQPPQQQYYQQPYYQQKPQGPVAIPQQQHQQQHQHIGHIQQAQPLPVPQQNYYGGTSPNSRYGQPQSQQLPPPPMHPQQQSQHSQYQQQVPPPQQQQQQSQHYQQEYAPPSQSQHSSRYNSVSDQTQTQSHPQKKPPPSQSIQYIQSSKNSNNRSKESLEYSKSPPQQISAKQKLENELRSVFDKVDSNHSGKISPKELSAALLNFDHSRFNDSTVLLMIKVFTTPDSDSSRSLNFDQFVQLWKHLSTYKKLFISADSDKSGDVSFGEFQKILEQMRYKLDVDLVLHLFSKYSAKTSSGESNGAIGKLKFDGFIELLVYLRKLTEIFRKYDKGLTGVATINFQEFLFEVTNLP